MLTTDNAKRAALDLIARGLGGGGKDLRANGFLSIVEAYSFERRRVSQLAAAYRQSDTGLGTVIDTWIPRKAVGENVARIRDEMKRILAELGDDVDRH